MNCPECHFDNPDSHRFCGMCGALVVARPSAETTAPVPESPAPRAAEEPATQESKTDNGRRPFIVQSTAHDTTSQVTRVAVTPTMGSSTHSNYPPVTLRSEVEDVYHGDYLPQPIVAPVDPEDEPLFSGETIHVVKTPEERERGRMGATGRGRARRLSAKRECAGCGFGARIDGTDCRTPRGNPRGTFGAGFESVSRTSGERSGVGLHAWTDGSDCRVIAPKRALR